MQARRHWPTLRHLPLPPDNGCKASALPDIQCPSAVSPPETWYIPARLPPPNPSHFPREWCNSRWNLRGRPQPPSCSHGPPSVWPPRRYRSAPSPEQAVHQAPSMSPLARMSHRKADRPPQSRPRSHLQTAPPRPPVFPAFARPLPWCRPGYTPLFHTAPNNVRFLLCPPLSFLCGCIASGSWHRKKPGTTHPLLSSRNRIARTDRPPHPHKPSGPKHCPMYCAL